jgi:hypothetical protein
MMILILSDMLTESTDSTTTGLISPKISSGSMDCRAENIKSGSKAKAQPGNGLKMNWSFR